MQHVYLCTGHELRLPGIVESRGVYVFDGSGRRYMDLEAGVWCLSLGHGNARVNRAITRQIGALMHAGFCYANPILETASTAILAAAGLAGGKSLFLCSGSEAIEVARQIAKHLTGKTVSMTLHDSYLGAYSSVTDRTRNWFAFDWEACRTCREKAHCDPGCERLQAIPDTVSDFVFEPGSASGFVRFPPEALIRNIAARVRRSGGKIIANEVTTGVGRTGTWFGYQHYAVEPDLVAMGKGIGNGYPVSVAAISRAVADELDARPFKYAQSHQNDPLGAAVALAVVREIEQNDLIAAAARNGARLRARLESLVDGRLVRAVRGRGVMVAVDLADGAVANMIYRDLIDAGYIVGNRGSTFRIDPPLTVTEAQLDEFFDAFRAVLASAARGA